MTKTNKTRSALFTSIISLLLCVSMLVGTTFAWFTDSVVSGNNVIAAGNLDIELYNGNQKVTESTNLFDGIKWEPGVVDYENFTIKNEGDLALVYDFAINWGDYNTLAGQYNLTQILKVAMVDGHVSGSREEVIAKGEGKWAALDSWSFSGEMTKKGDTKEFALIIYWEPSDNDNNWNVQNGKPLDEGEYLYVNLGINLQATQKMHESDSFGPDYDGLASDWDGSAGEVPAEEDGVITITTGAELAALAEAVNNGATYKDKTIKLGADIDLGNKKWTPIGQNGDKAGFQGTFDGQGHTIYNLYVDQTTRAYQSAGLFGSARYATIKNFKIVNATIKNLDATTDSSNGAAVVVGAAQFATTIDNVDVENANVTGNRRVAAIAGYYVGTITNCDVKNVNLVATFDDIGNGSFDNADKVGMIIAYSNGASTITNNTVTGGSINAYRDMGGIAGYATTSTLTGNKVSDLSITVNNAHNYKSYADLDTHDAGEVIGEGTADATNVAANVTIEMPVANTEDLIAAIKAGKTEIELADGNYVMPTSFNGSGVSLQGKTLKISGTRNVVIEASHVDERDQYVTGANLTFEGVTLNFGKTNYMGFANVASLTYKDCAVNGLQFCYGNDGIYTFEDCDLNSNGAEHSIWTWSGDKNISFTNCDFTYGDRAVNCYGENGTTNISFTDCTFTKVDGKETTGAIETNSSTLTALNLTIKNCSVNEGDLWWVSTWDGKDGANTHATVDGKTSVATATQITNAITAGATEVYLAGSNTIKFPSNGTASSVKFVGNDTATLDLTYGSYWESATLTFENVNFKTIFGYPGGAASGSDYAALYSKNTTYNNCSFSGGMLIGRDGAVFNGCTFNDLGNEYIRTYGNVVTFDKCTFNTDGKALLIYSDGNGVTSAVSVTNCTFNATKGAQAGAIKNQNCAAIEIDNYGCGVVLTTSGNTIDDDFSGEWRIKTYYTGNESITINGVGYTQIAIDGKLMTIDADKNVTVA